MSEYTAASSWQFRQNDLMKISRRRPTDSTNGQTGNKGKEKTLAQRACVRNAEQKKLASNDVEC